MGVSQQLSGAASAARALDPVADLNHKCSVDAAELDRVQYQGCVGPREHIVGIGGVVVAEDAIGVIQGVQGMCDEAIMRDVATQPMALIKASWPFFAASAGSGRPCGSDVADMPHRDGGRTDLVSSLSGASHGARGANAVGASSSISTSAIVTHLARSALCASARPPTPGQRILPPATTGVPSEHRGPIAADSATPLLQGLARLRENMMRTATPWTTSRTRSSQ